MLGEHKFEVVSDESERNDGGADNDSEGVSDESERNDGGADNDSEGVSDESERNDGGADNDSEGVSDESERNDGGADNDSEGVSDESERNDGGADNDSEVVALRHEIEVLKQNEAAALNKALRAQAELENVQKRARRNVEEAHRYALTQFVSTLLPVVDSLELGIKAAQDDAEAEGVVEGMKLTLKAFFAAFEQCGVVAVDPAVGDKFDVNEHEAMMMKENADTKSNTIVNILQKGYKLNGRLLRPVRVVVAK